MHTMRSEMWIIIITVKMHMVDLIFRAQGECEVIMGQTRQILISRNMNIFIEYDEETMFQAYEACGLLLV